jgi:capsular polysaccharide biosynthesis protein
MIKQQFLIDLYRRLLSRFLIFRYIKHLLLFLARKTRKFKSTKYKLSGTYTWEALAQTKNITSRLSVFSEERIYLAAPFFTGFGASEAKSRTPAKVILFPEVDLWTFKDGVVVGGVDFIFVNNQAIHHDLYVPEEHQCPAENLGVIQQRTKDKKNVDLCLTVTPVTIDACFSMIGQCSANYAHWLTETLPKLAVLDSTEKFDKVPLLIDEGLHSNIIESLNLINKKNRPVITINKWSPLIVRQLVTISVPGYERYAAHGLLNKEPAPFENKFSKASLKLLRDIVVASVSNDTPLNSPKKVYLARSWSSKNLRQIANINAVELFLDSQHVQRIQSDGLTFGEQVKACMSADLIVCPIGAALTNMIFAPTGCKIICLSPYYDDANYFYYANLAATLEHEIHFVLGKQKVSRNHPMHRDYSIDIELLKAHFIS